MLSLLLSQCPFMAVLALHEQVPRVMDHHSSGCLPGGNFPHSLEVKDVSSSGNEKLLAKSCNKSKVINRAMSVNEILEELPKLNAQELEAVSYRVQFLQALREGLKEITEGPLIPHEQVKKELAQWLSE
jgi:hypothetical protein